MDETRELDRKAPYWTSATVNARLAWAFAGADLREAALLLAALAPAVECPPEADETACRLMLAALRVADGSLAKLALWVEAARLDPRDLLVAAEYPLELAGGGEAAREADVAVYVAWAAAE